MVETNHIQYNEICNDIIVPFRWYDMIIDSYFSICIEEFQ